MQLSVRYLEAKVISVKTIFTVSALRHLRKVVLKSKTAAMARPMHVTSQNHVSQKNSYFLHLPWERYHINSF